MIILDTNVISAMMRTEPDAAVVSWLDGQATESVWTTSVTVFEILFGIQLLQAGRRRRFLEESFSKMLEEDLEARIVPFDAEAAVAAGRIAANQRKAGRTVEVRDVQIAGIALARRAEIATRNTRHFEGLGITLLDPWSE